MCEGDSDFDGNLPYLRTMHSLAQVARVQPKSTMVDHALCPVIRRVPKCPLKGRSLAHPQIRADRVDPGTTLDTTNLNLPGVSCTISSTSFSSNLSPCSTFLCSESSKASR